VSSPHPYPRLAEACLAEALTDTPVVLLHGPRQCGKTTLARMLGARSGHAYFTFDDAATLAAAEADPVGFVDDLPARTILDEVQRVPGLFTTLKRAVDRDRRPGRFLLTGSANVLLLPRLSDSLAGRMEIVRLHPLSQAELAGGPPDFIERLFAGSFPTRTRPRLGRDLPARIAAGGYPAALARAAAHRRMAWYRDYVETLVQRDVRELAHIASLDAIPRLLALVGAQTARLLNVSDLAAPLHLSRPTVRDYVTLLERIFLVEIPQRLDVVVPVEGVIIEGDLGVQRDQLLIPGDDERIAGGVMDAAKEVSIRVPLVVRLEGTNAEEARQMLADSGLNLVVSRTMWEGARKIVSLIQA